MSFSYWRIQMFHRLIAPLMIICMSCSFASNGASRLFGDSVDPLPAELKNFNGMLLGRPITLIRNGTPINAVFS